MRTARVASVPRGPCARSSNSVYEHTITIGPCLCGGAGYERAAATMRLDMVSSGEVPSCDRPLTNESPRTPSMPASAFTGYASSTSLKLGVGSTEGGASGGKEPSWCSSGGKRANERSESEKAILGSAAWSANIPDCIPSAALTLLIR